MEVLYCAIDNIDSVVVYCRRLVGLVWSGLVWSNWLKPEKAKGQESRTVGNGTERNQIGSNRIGPTKGTKCKKKPRTIQQSTTKEGDGVVISVLSAFYFYDFCFSSVQHQQQFDSSYGIDVG